MLAMVRAMLNTSYVDPDATAALAEEAARPHGPLVQLGVSVREREAVAVGAA